jgi:L,D-transpeptidase-like protein
VSQRAIAAATLVMLGAAGIGILITLADGDKGAGVGSPSEPPVARGVVPAGGETAGEPDYPVPILYEEPAAGTSYPIARLTAGETTTAYDAPAGRPTGGLGPETEFGSAVALAVVRTRGSWLGVQAPEAGNHELAWIRHDPSRIEIYWTRYSLAVDLSERRLEIRYGDRRLFRRPVTVGAAGTDTPQGRFAVTDALAFDGDVNYGCCALALSGHQANLPPGWMGGDRIAIHGTSGALGEAASAGCIRTSNKTMRQLFERVPLGTPVFIRD